ncbi:MAG TPA: FAD-binding oxidoreductase [Anaerolineae bacterium]|nr:FAD-binding oxidoreductase [Anaerolineae bacterium]
MKRWDGWGDEEFEYRITESAIRYLSDMIGDGIRIVITPKNLIINKISSNKKITFPQASTSKEDRFLHSRGQSLPDWIDIKFNRVKTIPDGVIYPTNEDDVHELLKLASLKKKVVLIPFGGGTSVLGHINPLKDKRPILSVDMSKMRDLIDLDKESQLAKFEAGVKGPDIEAQLRANGYTLGHYPQSFEYSTLGGWIATRSAGQESLKYGGIVDLFKGGVIETPKGTLISKNYPASGAGIDIRELILGSEGRLGIITKADVKISKIPEQEDFYGVFFPTWKLGFSAVRQIVQMGLPLSMLRYSTKEETEITLKLAGHSKLIGALESMLRIRGIGDEKCMLILGLSGSRRELRFAKNAARDTIKKNKGVFAGKVFGEQWRKSRFKTPYLRNTLWDLGYAVDTLETATTWVNIPKMIKEIESSLKSTAETFNERILVFTHLSHFYPTGGSIYTTVIFRIVDDPDELLDRWKQLKTAASEAIIRLGGTISHQHGVGLDHKQFLEQDKGELGVDLMSSIFKEIDPYGIMNPGKLV